MGLVTLIIGWALWMVVLATVVLLIIEIYRRYNHGGN